ncbi:MarR family transcriptional regulator [Paenibacillus sp. P26]|nr:MarR family transcriptional regulator [Paenibacillus sp. P26]
MNGKDGHVPESLGGLLAQTYRRVVQGLSQRFKPYGVTPEQYGSLHQLCAKEGIPQKELAERTDRDQPGVTRILDGLERKGWIERRPNAEDRRSFLVYPTEEGRKLDAVLTPIERQTIKDMFGCLNSEEERLLALWLKRVGESALQLQQEGRTSAAEESGMKEQELHHKS